MTLTATDMAQENQKSYYSTTSGGKNHEETATSYDLATLKVDGGESKTKYTCTGNVEVKLEAQTKLEQEGPAELPAFVEGDGKLHLEGATNLDGDSGTTLDVNLSELKAAASNTKTINDVTFALDGTTNTEKKLKGYLEVINTAQEQNYLADKSFKVTVTLKNINCTIDQTTVAE